MAGNESSCVGLTSLRRRTNLPSTWSPGQVALVGSLAGVVLVPVLRQIYRSSRQHVPKNSTIVSDTTFTQLVPQLLAGTDSSNQATVHGWANLPDEVRQIIFSLVPPLTCWTAREVSSAWTGQARQVVCFEVKFLANQFNLISRVAARTLCQQQLWHQLPNISVVFHLPQPISLKQTSHLLQELNSKTDCLSAFRLDLTLQMSKGSSQPVPHRLQVESSAKSLAKRGVMVSITLRPLKATSTDSADAVMFWRLAPFLAGIDMYSVPAQQTTTDWHVYKAATSDFSYNCVTDLMHCSANLSALSIAQTWSTRHMPYTLWSIAQQQGLTKLHLTLNTTRQEADFQPLSTLSKLEDLALQCACDSAACSSVLDSSKWTLRHVILASESWTLDTYNTLQQIPGLETVLIKLRALSAPEADVLAGVRAKWVHLDLRSVSYLFSDALSVLSTARPAAQVHGLTLRNATRFSCQHLGSLPLLESLTFINSPGLTGSLLSKHSKVTELRLINCSGINAAGLHHMLSVALPALKVLAFQAGDSPGVVRHLRLDVAALQMLSCGHNLTSVDLRGIEGLTQDSIRAVKIAFGQGPDTGRAHTSVTVHLPLHGLEHCQPFGEVHSSLFAPPFHAKLSEQVSRRVICKR